MKNVVKIELTNYQETKSILSVLVYTLENVTFKMTESKIKKRTTLQVITNKHALDIVNILEGLAITKHKVSFKIDNIWHYTYVGTY